MGIIKNTYTNGRLLNDQPQASTIHGEVRDAIVLSGVTAVNGKTGILTLIASDVGAVSYNDSQGLTEEQKAIARTNIDAIDSEYVNTQDNLKWNKLGQDENVTILLTGGNS